MKHLYALLGSLCIYFSVSASHIVGGGFSVQHINGSDYQLTLTVYRDCESSTDFNNVLYVGIFSKETNMMIDSFGMTRGLVSKINPARANCVTEVPGCTERAVYTREINLSPLVYNNTAGYYISWERCCRNNIIQNIFRPREASMAFYAEIPSPGRFINSTPQLSTNPFTVLCLDNLFTYDISFKDSDKDSLVYEMITPVNGTLTNADPNDDQPGSVPILNRGPYEPVSWLPGFSANAAITGDPPLGINRQTGLLTVKPSLAGVFVLGIKVSEYRKGVLLGFVHLELQFTVVNCITNQFPVMKLYQNGNVIPDRVMYVTIPDTIRFGLSIEDADELDTVILNSELENEPADKLGLTIQRTPQVATYNWNWKTHCDLHAKAVYKVTVTATDKGCPIPKTSQVTFEVRVQPMPVLPSTDVLCIELRDNKSAMVYFGDSARHKPYFKQYKIYRSEGGDVFRLYDSIPDRMAGAYFDRSCSDYKKINYRYMIRVENVCGYEGLSSDTLGTFDQLRHLPEKQYMYNVTVNNDHVLITWNQTKELDFARYFLWKGYRNQKPEQFVMELDFPKQKDTVYLDKKVNIHDTSHCYYVIMLDTCGNYGPPGEIFCTTVLRGRSQFFENQVNWQPFVQSDEFSVQYDLHKYAPQVPEQMSVGLFQAGTLTSSDDKLDPDDGRYLYEVDVLHRPVGHSGVIARSTSNRLPLSQKPFVHVPNAFSPNDDGINDTWYVSDVFVKDYSLRIVNKWGQVIFETDDKNRKWDGTDLKGEKVPPDVYIYLINFNGWDDMMQYQKGNVTLLR